MATTKIIGKVSIIPCGTYVDGTTYTRLSVVNYQGGSYIALVDNTNIVPTNDSVWYLLTAPGRGIQQIEKIGTVGLVDTYRITYTDGTHFDYTVNNGASKTSELENDAGFITNQVDDLANYLLAIDTGAYIELSYDSEGHTVTANLKNSSDTIISTGTAQLPLGGNYVSSSYDDGVITLTKLNGTSDTIELSDLVKKSTTIAGLYLADNITASELIEALDVYTIPEINENFYSNSVVGENITIDDASNLNINEIDLLGNATQLTTTGKNLFAFGLTAIDKTVDYRPTATQRLTLTATDNVNEVKFNYGGGSYNRGYLEMNGIDGTQTYSISFKVKQNTTSYTPTVTIDIENSTSEKLVFYIGGNNGSTATSSSNYFILTNIQVEKSASASSYEPYTGGIPAPNPDYPQDIHVVTGDNTLTFTGKNLYDIGQVSNYSHASYVDLSVENSKLKMKITRNGMTFVYKEQNFVGNNEYSISWTASNIYPRGFIRLRKLDDSGWMTNADTSITGWTYVNAYDGWYIEQSSRDFSKAVSIPKCLYWQLGLGYNSVSAETGTYVTIADIQLELNNTSTLYVPYQGTQTQLISLGDIELVKMGNYQDRLYKSGDKWYVEKNIVKILLNGTESNWESLESSIPYRISIPNFVLPISQNTKPLIMNNLFPVDAWNNNSNYPNYFCSTTSNESYARFRNTDVNDLSEFKTWLASHNMSLYYVTNNPVTMEITNSTLISQLNNIAKFNTYRNITHMSTTTNNLQPTLYVNYVSDIQIIIEELQEKNQNLLNQIPQKIINGQFINVQDSSNLPIQDFQIQGNISQNTNIMTYVCNGTESGYYYFVYNNTNYQFIMPTISQGDLLAFNTTTLKLYKGTTEIATTTDNTGTLITLSSTPNPDYPQDIHVVTGDNSVNMIGKNLFTTANKVYASSSSIAYTATDSNNFSATTNQSTAFIVFIVGKVSVLKGKTIYASANYTSDANLSGTSTSIITCDSSGGNRTLLSGLSFSGGQVTGSALIDNSLDESKYIAIRLYVTPAGTTSSITTSYNNIQVEINSTSTSFVPYQTPQTQLLSLGNIELAKIGDYTDRIFKAVQGNSIYDSLDSTTKASLNVGSWYKQGNIAKQIFDGTNGGDYISNYGYYRLPTPNHGQNSNLLANRLQIGENETVNYIVKSNSNNYVWVWDVQNLWNSSGSNFLTWLSQNNLTLYWSLRTPTYTEIIDTTLIEQLENVLKMHTYKNVTNGWIEPTSTNAQGGLQITYKQDLDTLLDNLDARISLLE